MAASETAAHAVAVAPADRLDEVVRSFRWTRDLYGQLRDAGILGEDDRVELIEGELVEMAAKNAPHRVAVGLADDVLRSIFGAGYHVQIQDPLGFGAFSEPEPDAAVIPGDRRDYRDQHPSTAVLVVEVAESSLRYDRERKASLYARMQIPEMWLVNLQERVLEVYREPRADRTAAFGASYSVRLILEPTDTVAPLAAPQTTVAVAALLP